MTARIKSDAGIANRDTLSLDIGQCKDAAGFGPISFSDLARVNNLHRIHS